MSADRWERLRADLAAAGIDATITERPHSESSYGRVRHGVTRSITIVTADALIGIHDRWWTKNPDHWLGWTVQVEGRADSITRSEQRGLKKRSDVIAAVERYVAVARHAHEGDQ